MSEQNRQDRIFLFPVLSQAVVYEKPDFQGSSLEIDSDLLGFCLSEGGISAADVDSEDLVPVGSLKITRGL